MKDPESVADGVREAEAVVYTTALDEESVGKIAGALEGSGKPFVSVIGATIYGDTGEREAVEGQPLAPPSALEPMAEAEKALLDAAGRDVRSASVRAALVYGRHGGEIPKLLLDDARKSGMARYVGTGGNRWAAVHVDDLAHMLVLAVEKAPAGTAFNAATENVSMHSVAETVGQAVGAQRGPWSISPKEALGAWGFFGGLLTMNLSLSGKRAREVLGWKPVAPSIFEDLV